MKKMLFDYKEELKNKFSYDEDLAQTIAISAESIVEQFGDEYKDVIWDAVMSCQIVVANNEKKESNRKIIPVSENIYDVLKRENMLDFEQEKLADLKKAEGAYVSIPEITFENGEYQVKSVKRIIVLNKSFNPVHPNSLALITEELLHLINSYVNEYTIDESLLVKRNGLAKSEYSLTVLNDTAVKNHIKTIGEGFEEGVVSYDVQSITRNSYHTEYEALGYTYQRLVSGFMIDSLEMKEAIKEAQITGNLSALESLFEILGIGYTEFLNMMDELSQKDYNRVMNVQDAAKLKTATEELDSYFISNIVPMVRTMHVSMENQIGDKNVVREGKKLS